MPSTATARRRRNRQRGKARKAGVPPGEFPGESSMPISTYNVPPRNYLQTHVAGVSQSLRRTLVYTAAVGQATTGTTFTESGQVILNGLFLPFVASGSSPFTGYLKYMAFYSKCFPLGCRVKVKYAMAGSTAAGAPTNTCVVGSTITTNATVLATLAGAVDEGLTDYRIVNQHPDAGVLNLSVDFGKFVNKPDIMDDPQWYGTVSANPAQLIVLHIWVDVLGTLNTTSFNYVVEVETDCVFTDPIPFG